MAFVPTLTTTLKNENGPIEFFSKILILSKIGKIRWDFESLSPQDLLFLNLELQYQIEISSKFDQVWNSKENVSPKQPYQPEFVVL